MTTAFLADKKQEIDERAAQLERELEELRAASAALGQFNGGAGAGAPMVRRPAARRRTAAKNPASTRAKNTGTRADEAMSLITATPGITIPELAETMGIKQNYLYRVVPGLEKAGKAKRVGERGWAPADWTEPVDASPGAQPEVPPAD